MSAAGVTPAMGDGPKDNEYATAPIRRPSAAYTGEPDMPAQMPPARVIAGESVSTMIISRPEAMPSLTTPRTVAVNGSGVFPFSTVSPLATMPGTRLATGNGSGRQSSAGVACAVDVVSQVAASAALINAAKTALGTRLVNGRLVVMTLLLMGLPVHTLDGDSMSAYRHARYPVNRSRSCPPPAHHTHLDAIVASFVAPLGRELSPGVSTSVLPLDRGRPTYPRLTNAVDRGLIRDHGRRRGLAASVRRAGAASACCAARAGRGTGGRA